MTLRLVGLMSLVLALCLATFAFMTRRYHDEVMDELPHTVAQAGREAIRSLEPFHFRTTQEASWEWVSDDPGDDRTADTGPRLEELRRTAEASATRFLVARGAVEGVTAVEILDCEGDDCLTWSSDDGDGASTRVIDLQGIHAETDPATGVVLRIPTLRTIAVTTRVVSGEDEPDATAAPPPGAVIHHAIEQHEDEFRVVMKAFEQEAQALARAAGEAPDAAGTAVVRPASLPAPALLDREIVLPIGTDDYHELYDRFRTKSLLLLAGVFGVGLALTTGLATRFTRPVRRLDRALREISDGNLDVRVPAHGRDEIARLGRAFNDMTAKLQDSRARARELTRREKLSALGRLAAGVAHDVRNPLHSISLTLAHLSESARPDGEERARDFDRSIEIIREEIRRLDGLVSSFLRFAASGGRERTRVRLGSMLDEVTRLVRKEAEWRNVRVSAEVRGDDPEVVADVESIRSALLNLVLNAFEAMPDGGDLHLTARAEDRHAVLEVRDTGVGIPADDHERVFEFAYSTREGGNGLGLAIVHQCVVEDHGGSIALDSRPGEGTTITLRLPAAADDGPLA